MKSFIAKIEFLKKNVFYHFQRINVGEHILHFLVLVTGCNSAGKLGTSEIYRVTNVATGKKASPKIIGPVQTKY